MNRVFTIRIDQLVPGMILAADLRQDRTGLVLIPKGTLINNGHLGQLGSFSKSKECVIYDPARVTAEEDLEFGTIQPDSTFEEFRALPMYIASSTQKVYVETYDAVKELFKKEIIQENDVEEIRQTATKISEEISRDPQILLQVAVLKAIDNYTFSHSIHVAIYAATLAGFLNYPPDQIKEICLAGLLHDIGKMEVPRDIVEKPGRLTDEEFKVMKEHARLGYERLKNLNNLSSDIIEAISQHHEKIDGSGYYQGLKGEKIHPWSRILATADVYDAVTTNRVYRGALLPHEGAEIVMGCSVGHLDYQLVKTFSSSISFYPVGTRVLLNTGEKGKVIDLHPSAPLRPIIRVEDGSKRIIDLAKNLVTFITHIVI